MRSSGSALTSATHSTTTDGIGVYAPTMVVDRLPAEGIVQFIDSQTNEPVGYDVANLKRDGRTHSTIIGKYAEIGAGKTADNMVFAYSMWMRDMDGRRTKVSIDDLRMNDGKPEYGKLCKLCGVEPVELRKYRLNLLDMHLKLLFSQQVHLVRGALEIASGEELNTRKIRALRYGLKKVREMYGNDAITGDLVTAWRSLDLLDILYYETSFRKYQDDSLLANRRRPMRSVDREASQEMRGEAERLQKAVARREHYLLIQAALELADMLENLLDGEFGELFGGEHSLAEVMKRSMVIWDYNGLSETSIGLVQFMLWQIKGAAILRNDHDFFFDVEIHDENYSMWSIPVYAKEMAKFIKRIRSTSIIVVLTSHRLADYNTVGDDGSAERKLAVNMTDDIGIWQVGKVSPQTAAQFQQKCGLTDEERDMLPHLKVGHWGLKIGTGSEPMHFVQRDLTPLELKLIFSDDANAKRAKPSRTA